MAPGCCSPAAALATVFVDRAFDVFALVAFLAISLVFVSSAEWLLRMAVGRLILFGAIALILIVSRAYTRRQARDRRRARLPAANRRDGRRSRRASGHEPNADARGSQSRHLGHVGARGVLRRSRGRDRALGGQGDLPSAVINLGVAIPSSPGFIGTYQWLGVTALSHFDVATEQALAFAILMHAVWYVPTTVVGGRCSSVAGSSGR